MVAHDRLPSHALQTHTHADIYIYTYTAFLITYLKYKKRGIKYKKYGIKSTKNTGQKVLKIRGKKYKEVKKKTDLQIIKICYMTEVFIMVVKL